MFAAHRLALPGWCHFCSTRRCSWRLQRLMRRCSGRLHLQSGAWHVSQQLEPVSTRCVPRLHQQDFVSVEHLSCTSRLSIKHWMKWVLTLGLLVAVVTRFETTDRFTPAVSPETHCDNIIAPGHTLGVVHTLSSATLALHGRLNAAAVARATPKRLRDSCLPSAALTR
jgi:hypothetical protein